MSIILKEARKQEVHWMLPWNIGEEANDKLLLLLGQLDCYFAKNKIKAGGYVWEAPDEGWKSFAVASESERAQIRSEYLVLSGKVAERLNKIISNPSSAQSLAERIMIIPNDEYIYYRFNENGIILLLTAWGFKSRSMPIIPPPKPIPQSGNIVRIGFMSDNLIFPNHPFAILKQTTNELQTNEDGFYELGNRLKTGTEFNIVSRVSGEQFQFTVIEGQSDYIFNITIPTAMNETSEPIVVMPNHTENATDDEKDEIIVPITNQLNSDESEQESNRIIPEDLSDKYPADITIQLFDQKGTPIPQTRLLLINHKKKEFSSITNNDGCILVPHSYFTDKKRVKVLPQIKDVKATKFKYTDTCNFYKIYIKEGRKKKFPWWIFLFLLLLLLLVRCEHDIKVTCIDGKTGEPIENVDISLDYTAHLLYDNGKFFVNKEHSHLQYTDKTGSTIFKDIECSVFSYLFYFLSKVKIVAEENAEYSGLCHFTRHVVFTLESIECDVDIAMCIDHTASMGYLLNMVKENAMNFHSDLKKYCEMRRRKIKNIRIKVISFGDLREEPIKESVVFTIPQELDAFNDYVERIKCFGGGDLPENGLEALALAINTDWVKTDIRHRHIILMYTDAPAHQLGSMFRCPPNMPRSLDELEDNWNGMDEKVKRLVLFAPHSYPWSDIAFSWNNVVHKTENLNVIFSGKGYEDILEAICRSL